MANKPVQVSEKIVMGKMNKFYQRTACCSRSSSAAMCSPALWSSISTMPAKKLGGSVKFVDAVRFEKGEGIEKKEDDFAAEVASMIK